MSEASARETLKRLVGEIKVEVEDLSKQVKHREDKIYQLLLLIPQPASQDVPIGNDDSETLELRKVGTQPKFDPTALDHMDLTLSLMHCIA